MAAWSKVSWGDLFTLANGLMGFVAITFILDDRFLIATSLLFLSMMMDGIDGYVARRFGSKHTMGQVLDSISDSVSFAFAPAFLVYVEFRSAELSLAENGVVLLCAIAIVGSGLFRLARFSAGGFQLPHFQGMPAPAGALMILLICQLFGASAGAETPKYYFTISEQMWLVLATGFAVSYLMASEIPYPKVQGRLTLLSGLALLMAVIPLIAGTLFVDDQSLYRAFSRTATGLALALTLVYVLGGPFYEKYKRDKI